MLRINIILLVLLLPLSSYSQQYTLTSPSNSVRLNISNSSSLTYSLSYKKKKVIEPSSLGISFQKPTVSLTQFSILKVDSSAKDDLWIPVWGEVDKIRNNYKELIKVTNNQSLKFHWQKVEDVRSAFLK